MATSIMQTASTMGDTYETWNAKGSLIQLPIEFWARFQTTRFALVAFNNTRVACRFDFFQHITHHEDPNRRILTDKPVYSVTLDSINNVGVVPIPHGIDLKLTYSPATRSQNTQFFIGCQKVPVANEQGYFLIDVDRNGLPVLRMDTDSVVVQNRIVVQSQYEGDDFILEVWKRNSLIKAFQLPAYASKLSFSMREIFDVRVADEYDTPRIYEGSNTTQMHPGQIAALFGPVNQRFDLKILGASSFVQRPTAKERNTIIKKDLTII